MKKTLFTFLIILLLPMSFASGALAYQNILENFAEGVEEQSDTVDTESIELTTFQDRFSSDGLSGMQGAVKVFLDFFKLLVAPITVLFMVITGARMVGAGSEDEEAWAKGKRYMTYCIMGLILIFMSDSIVNVFFGSEGEVFRGGRLGAIEFGRRTATLFQGLYSFIQVLISGVAVFFLITAGMRYVAGSYSDDQVGKAKTQITWSLVGLFVVGISEFLAKRVLFVDQGASIGVASAKQLFAQVTNFIAGTLGTLSFAALLYAGILYISGSQNEENASKAKNIIKGAVLGLVLATAAYAITNTIVELDVPR